MKIVKNRMSLKIIVFAIVAMMLFWLIPSGIAYGEGESASPTIEELQAVLDSANTDVSDALNAVEGAQTAVDEATDAANLASETATADEAAALVLQGSADTAAADALVLQTTATAAQVAATAAQDAANVAQDAADDAQLLAEQEPITQENIDAAIALQTTATAAQDAATALQTTATAAQVAATAAQDAANVAQDAADIAKSTAEVSGAAANAADTAVINAEAALETAQADLNEAIARADAANTALQEAINNAAENEPEKPTIKTDKSDYKPEETVKIIITGFAPSATYTVEVIRPDGSIIKGNGNFEDFGSDAITTNPEGNFVYEYILDGIVGEYLVNLIDESGVIVATTSFTDDTGTEVNVDLHSAHENSDCDTFQQDSDNGGLTDPVVWHFVLNQLNNNTPAATVTATFQLKSGGPTFDVTVTASELNKKMQHFYIGTSDHAILINAFATVAGPQGGPPNLLLSHVCHNNVIPTTGKITVNKVVKDQNGTVVNDDHTFYISIDGGTAGQQNLSFSQNSPYSFIGLQPGTYTIVESSDPNYSIEGYSPGATVTVAAGEEKTITVTNKHNSGSGTITVRKDVRRPGLGLFDVSDDHWFTVNLYQKPISGGSWTKIDTMDINESTPAVFSVPRGFKYKVIEQSDPDYDKISDGGDVTLHTGDNNKNICVINKQEFATIKVFKNVLDRDGNDINDDALFGLRLNGTFSWPLLSGFKEGSPAQFSVWPGTYSVNELPLLNYELVNNGGSVTIGSNGYAEITVINKQDPGTITVYKDVKGSDGTTDVSDSTAFGVTLQKMDSKGNWADVSTASIAEGAPAVFYVNRECKTISFRAIETANPNYSEISNSGIVELGISEDNENIYIVNAQGSGRLNLQKVDSTNILLPVADATYEIYGSGGVLVERITTASDGWAFVSGLKFGTYTVKETIEPPGYALDPITYTFTIDGANPSATLYVKDTPLTGGGGGTLTVAGLTKGIQVLAFTGIDPIIPISGGSTIIAGIAMLALSLRKRFRSKK